MILIKIRVQLTNHLRPIYLLLSFVNTKTSHPLAPKTPALTLTLKLKQKNAFPEISRLLLTYFKQQMKHFYVQIGSHVVLDVGCFSF